MNVRFTIIVVLVCLALLLVAYTQRDVPQRRWGEGAPTATPPALLELSPDEVQEVSVSGAGGQYKLTKVAGGWEVDGQKASDAVAGMVERLSNPSVVRDLPADRKPEDYGFATPSLTVTLKTAAGAESVLEVGDDTPADYNVYLRLKGESRIVVVSRSDIATLKDWITTPPLAPTPTPTAGTPGSPEASTLPTAGTEAPPPEGAGVPTVIALPATATPLPPATPTSTVAPTAKATTAAPTAKATTAPAPKATPTS